MIRRLVLAVVAACGTLLTTQPAEAWCQMTTSDPAPTPGDPCPSEGVPLAWERSCISYALDEKGSADLDLEVVRTEAERSFSSWMTIACPDGGAPPLEVRQLAPAAQCDRDEFNPEDGNVNVIAFVDDWEERGLEGADRIFALTTVWHARDTGEILDVDMLVNEEQGPYAICPSTGCSGRQVDLRNVLTHEIGHFFGMAHTDVDLSSLPMSEWPTMAATSPRGATFMQTLEDDDVDGFCSMYPPGSLPNICETEEDFAPLGGYDLNCADDGNGGRCGVAAGPGFPATPGWSWGLLLLTALLVRRRLGRRVNSGDAPRT